MSGLVLRPTIHDYSREEVEAYIEAIRAKRMAATIEYHHSKNEKIAHLSDKIQRQYLGQLEMLEKEIGRLEAAEEKIVVRLNKIDELKQELGMLTEKVVDTATDPDEET